MNFLFFCPLQHQTFQTEDFQIIENRGVLLDKAGNKYLDMTVQISSPCPFCGEKHIFHANELACPFPDD